MSTPPCIKSDWCAYYHDFREKNSFDIFANETNEQNDNNDLNEINEAMTIIGHSNQSMIGNNQSITGLCRLIKWL